jgi:hypothetical protein
VHWLSDFDSQEEYPDMAVFGRNDGLPHPYDDELSRWSAHKRLAFRAMARNLMFDHRVSSQREAAFHPFANGAGRTLNLHNAVVKYHKERIQLQPTPDFLDTAINADNMISLPNGILPTEEAELVRVLDLSGLSRVFSWAIEQEQDEWKGKFVGLVKDFEDEQLAVWLRENLQLADGAEDFICFILDVLNDYQKKKGPFHPTWATTWEAFRRYEKALPDRWAQVLGIVRKKSRWVVVLKYPVREAGHLVRPTQLEAGWYPFHFPSPPTAPLEGGGHPMDLLVSSDVSPLLPEYIHAQIAHHPTHLVCWGLAKPGKNRLRHQRIAHHQKLAGSYDHVPAWMPDPI